MKAPILLALLLCSTTPSFAASGVVFVDAGRGPVAVQVPNSYDPAVPTPMVMLLHGFTGSGPQLEAYLSVNPLVDQLGFLYLYPTGSTNPVGQTFWNATGACCDFFGSGIDDSAYLRALIDAVKLQFNVDPTRVHVGGHSNGGFMSYRMACDHSEAIASIISLAGATHNNPALCNPDEPVQVLQIHGTSDNIILYNGGNIGGATYPSAVGSVEQWATFGGCSLVSTPGAPLDLDAGIGGFETTVDRYESACVAGGYGELWSIVGGGHVPNISSSFTPEFIGWLMGHPKPSPSSNYCTANPHSGGRAASILATGSASLAEQNLRLIGYGAPANTPALFMASLTQSSTPFGDGFLCVAGPIYRIQPPMVTTDGGDAFRTLDFSGTYGGLFLSGVQVNFQLWFRDPAAGGAGFNTSDACSVTFMP